MVQQIRQRRAMHHKEDLYSIERFENCLAIRLTDRVDSINFGDVLGELGELLKSEGTARVVLDMRTVEMLQSVALNRIVQFEKAIRDNGGTIQLCNVQPMIANVLEVTKLNKLVEVAECEQAAIRDWGSPGNGRNPQPVGPPRIRQHDAHPPRRRRVDNQTAAVRALQVRSATPPPPTAVAATDQTTAEDESRETHVVTTRKTRPQRAASSDSIPTASGPGVLQTIYDLGWIGLHTKFGLAAVAVIVVFGGYRLFGTGPSAGSSYRYCVATYQEVSGLRDAKADANRWNSFEQQTRARMTPHITKLSRSGADRSEFQSEVLAALKSLATVIEEDRNTPGNADADVQRHLANAKALLE